MATYTTVGICNHALVLCGASPITALTDDSANARALNAVYETSRKGFLTECRWTFALTRSTISTVSTSTWPWFRSGESYVYTMPTNCLRLWEVSDIEAMWRKEGNFIISNTPSLGTLFTFDHSEVGLWGHKSVAAFIDKLCVDISYMILNNVQKAEAFLNKYNKVSLPDARADESQTGQHQEVVDFDWMRAKNFNSGGDPSRSYG